MCVMLLFYGNKVTINTNKPVLTNVIRSCPYQNWLTLHRQANAVRWFPPKCLLLTLPLC